jgi:hypothetical protein
MPLERHAPQGVRGTPILISAVNNWLYIPGAFVFNKFDAFVKAIKAVTAGNPGSPSGTGAGTV